MADDPNETSADNDGTSETPEPSDTTTTTNTTSAAGGEPEIPAALKAVIDKERKLAREAVKRANSAEADLAKLRETNMTEHERAVKAARDTGLSEGVKAGNARLLRAEVISAAAGKFVQPDEAFVFLKDSGLLDDVAISDDGEVDGSAINSAIEDLLKAKPHLASSSRRNGPTPGNRSPAPFAAEGTDAFMDAWIRAQSRK